MRRRNRRKAKRNVSLAHRRKYYFVRPDEDMRVLWNPNTYIAKYAALVLKDFIAYNDLSGGVPGEFCHLENDKDCTKGYQMWRGCMEEMLFAFEFYADDRRSFDEEDEATNERVQHGLDLFAKYFCHLWI